MGIPAVVHSQTSGTTPPPPPVCSSGNAGAIYTNTSTQTVYTCTYYNLAWQWMVNPIYGGLVAYPTVPSTCSGVLPAFVAGWPTPVLYLCENGFPTPVGVSAGVSAIIPGAGISCTPLVSGQCTGAVTISLGSAFAITSFTGCGGSLELGQTVTNPICSATYTTTPTSASITNTDSVDSPLVLSSPFTSGTILGSFLHTTVATTTVHLTAIGSSTQMANQTYSWNPRIFGGLGAAGATSAVTASGTTAVLSTSDVLPSASLGAETVGQTFGPYSPVGRNIYLLLSGGSHTFIDALTGFPFAFNAPTTVTFVNQYGVTVIMYLYQSTNVLMGTFQPKIGS